MIRSELVQKMQEQYPDLPPKDVDRLVSLFFQTISDHLAGGGRVELRGFGAFSLRERDARMSRNPRTGETVPVVSKKAIHFKTGKAMLARIQPQGQGD
ncbi:HU family DNA-binding protein [Sphingobium sp. CFD-2]|uniref:HU family DNA-binding protein n=1 Tax=Sphingobium sp. CFD-2 TaxID=2878542 RepID=UPI00214C00B7|nr:HU family DNA-binding protein [Sphingobium sp. CFD-2]